jgi:hypothetical protein
MNEAERLLKSIMEYAMKKRGDGVRDFMQIMESYAGDVLSEQTRTNLNSSRYMNAIREYCRKDPVVQGRLVGFFDIK